MQTSNHKIPGVFLNEIAPKPKPELLTGVPLFLGLASASESGKNSESGKKLRKLTFKTDFDQYFAQDPKHQGYFRDAVRGFFENGGRLCYAIALAENTLDELQKGLLESETFDDIDLVCAPDIMFDPKDEDKNLQLRMQKAVLEHCEKMGDRFAILDVLNVTNDIVKELKKQQKELTSDYGALYTPWLKIENTDPKQPKTKLIPPCGHVAGTYASRDRTEGVHNAPANIPLEGIIDLNFTITPAQQNSLNPQNEPGVNCIRSFSGRGMRVWGERTLSPLVEWQYVNVRRLFLTFGRWVNRNLADTVFEPNDFPLWVRLDRELNVYCESLWRQGALQGAAPQEAFYVRCDEETNPSENREVGRVVAEVGLAPSVPGEFIELLLVQSDSGITVT